MKTKTYAKAIRHATKALLFLSICLLCIIACKKEEPAKNNTNQYSITGKVQKGPFIKGSEVTLKELDEQLTETGKRFT